jgi:two-component system response regulator MprA
MASILIVEDDPDIREAVQDLLQLEGFSVVGAGNGAEGLSYLTSCTVPPKLILLDLMMPQVNGHEFIREKLRLAPALAAIPIVVLSADNMSRNRADPLPVVAYLRKPIDVEALIAAVKAHAGH